MKNQNDAVSVGRDISCFFARERDPPPGKSYRSSTAVFAERGVLKVDRFPVITALSRVGRVAAETFYIIHRHNIKHEKTEVRHRGGGRDVFESVQTPGIAATFCVRNERFALTSDDRRVGYCCCDTTRFASIISPKRV